MGRGWMKTSSLSSDLQDALRRAKPEKRQSGLRRRPDDRLPFAGLAAGGAPYLADTTVYVHALQKRLPPAIADLLGASPRSLHSAVCLAELAVAISALDLRNPGTRSRRAALKMAIERAPESRTLPPSRLDWLTAGLLAGVLLRIQGLAEAARRSVFNDALILLTARRFGATVVTANIADFDLLTQLVPDARVAFYRPL